jgi:hypothetical protein
MYKNRRFPGRLVPLLQTSQDRGTCFRVISICLYQQSNDKNIRLVQSLRPVQWVHAHMRRRRRSERLVSREVRGRRWNLGWP